METRKQAEAWLRSSAGLWVPNPGPQTEAYLSKADELFYGGAAGGGKTDLLAGLALTAHARTVIFRHELKQTSAIVDRLAAILGNRRGYNGQERAWKLDADRVVEFGGCPHPGDEAVWQGRPHDLKAFDEITQFLEVQYRYLIAWNRSTEPQQRCRVVCTGNPPTAPEGEWVVQYWAPWLDPGHPNPARPGALRWFAVIDGADVEREGPDPFPHRGEWIVPRSRTFIPSAVDDNPFLARTGYKATLQSLPEPLRSKMLHGDFEAGKEDDPFQAVPTAWVTAAQDRWKADGGCGLPMDAIGVDVARGGADQTVIAPRHGPWFGPLQVFDGAQTPDGDTAAALIQRARRDGAPIHVDLTGVGAAVYDACRRKRMQVVGFVAAARAGGRDASGQLAFANKRAESYWRLREALDPDSGQDMALPPDRLLRADITAARYKLTPRGIQLEDKAETVKRIGRSPDRGDAVALALYGFRKHPVGTTPAGGAFDADTDFEVL